MSMSEWVVKNTRLRKKPFSFKGYEFQRQILDDMHPNMSVIKCSQIGLTEIQIRKFLAFLARNTGVSAIFTLPDDAMYKRVSQTRVKPLVESEPVFNMQTAEKPIRSMSLYQINQSFGYFTGNKEGDATSINADALFHDEVDLSDQEMLALFQSRLQGSDYRITQGFSTPTYEGFGIDAGFRVSDQHEYMCKCTKCRHHNIPAFTPDFVTIPGLSGDINDLSEIDAEIASRLDLGAAYIRCESCGAPLDLHDPSLREWVPRYPGRRSRGYRVTPFSTPRLTIGYIVDQLLKYKERDALRRWYNTVLGESYNDSSARLTEAEIRAVMRGPSRLDVGDAPVVIGIDVGLTCHLVLMAVNHNTPMVFDWRQVLAENLLDEIKTIMQTYNVIGGCMDRNPYTPLANEVRDETNSFIIPVEYAGTPSAAAVQIMKDELDQLSHIRANRTTMIDTVVSAVRKRKVDFAGYGQFEALILQHLRDMVRIEKEDTSATWQKLSGNDHFFHALAYAFYAVRVHNALEYRNSDENRDMFSVSNIIIPMNVASQLGSKSRVGTSISLGSLY